GPPGHARASFDRHFAPALEADAAAVEQGRSIAAIVIGAAEVEDTLVLEKEVSLLGEEQAEPGQVDLLLVGLDLGEIGVVGEVGGEAAGDTVLDVDPGV